MKKFISAMIAKDRVVAFNSTQVKCHSEGRLNFAGATWACWLNELNDSQLQLNSPSAVTTVRNCR
jgi:hypothetical protein